MPTAIPADVGVKDADPQGHAAVSPWQIPARGWREVATRTWSETSEDNIGLIAAGVAFYAFLALVPMLGAIVLSYGLVASPASVVKEMQSLTSVMPADAARLIGEQLLNVIKSSDGKKGAGLLLALAIALYGAMKGATSTITALNIAYEQEETRGFITLNLLALAVTACGIILAIIAVTAIGALGHLESLVPNAPVIALVLGKALTYVIMGAGGSAAAAALYRYGPDRHDARWVWLTPGSVLATMLWLTITFGFGVYVANFGSYNATYGSLAAVVVLLTWLYLSSYTLLLGAELNSELERQTVRDTTVGPEKPLGKRRATVADTVAGDDISTCLRTTRSDETDVLRRRDGLAAEPSGIPHAETAPILDKVTEVPTPRTARILRFLAVGAGGAGAAIGLTHLTDRLKVRLQQRDAVLQRLLATTKDQEKRVTHK